MVRRLRCRLLESCGLLGLISSAPCFASACAATVQDFLERYEVGETIGVGGEPLIPACCTASASAAAPDLALATHVLAQVLPW